LIVDDQATARARLRAAVARQPDMTVVGEAATGEESARVARDLAPDVAIVNVAVPAARVAESVAPVLRSHPGAAILVVNLQDEDRFRGSALRAGATDCVVRKPGPDELGTALRAVRRLVTGAAPGRRAGGDGRAAAGDGSGTGGPAARLSARERQVLDLLARGHTRREIAERLAVGVKSVETYRSRLTRKLGFHTRADLVRYALESGLLRAAGPPTTRGVSGGSDGRR
jgi:DNA-binding NarL/FixJ family response regulator